MLKVEVVQSEGRASLSLLGDDGRAVAEWVQVGDDSRVDLERVELHRFPGGDLASVAAGGVITIVDVASRRVVARARTESTDEVTLPLGPDWTLTVCGGLMLDGGFSGHYGGHMGFAWPDPESRPPAAERGAEIARLRAELRDAAMVPLRRRVVVAAAADRRTVVVHEAESSRVEGGVVLLWPPSVGPAGLLLRHAVVVDDGSDHSVESQPPWLVEPDGTVKQLPFELGVSPLTTMDDGRWLLPGVDALWLDGYDGPLSLLDRTGRVEPLLVAGRPVRVSRVLDEAAPHLRSALGPVDPDGDVPWQATGARWERATDELLLTIEVDTDDSTCALLVVGVPLDGSAPARMLASVESTHETQVAVAP